MPKSVTTRNVQISTGTVADIMRRVYRTRLDAPRFHDQIGAVKGAGSQQLNTAAQRFLAEVGNVDNPAANAARAYVAAADTGESAKALFDAMTAYIKAIVPTDAALALVQAAGFATAVDELFWGPLFGFRGRVTNYWSEVLEKSQDAAAFVVEKWCESNGLTPDPIPDEPFSQGALSIMKSYTLAEIIRRGKRMDDDLLGIADDVDALLTASLDQLTDLLTAGPAFDDSTNLGKAIADYLATPEDERKLKVSGLTARAADHLSGLGMDTSVLAILEASGRSWQLFRLFVQAEELYNRVRKFGDIENQDVFPALQFIYNEWCKGEGAAEVAQFGTNPPPLPEVK